MISLGCAKNLVDAEIMLGGVLGRGMQITADAEEADVLIVNNLRVHRLGEGRVDRGHPRGAPIARPESGAPGKSSS